MERWLAVFIGVLALLGAVNLFWAARRRESPAERNGFLLAASSSILCAAALWAHSARFGPAAITAFGLAGASAIGWLYHVYTQSLHNTTM